MRRHSIDALGRVGEMSTVGPQGGDPRHRPKTVDLDLSTCVSRYGPPPAALDALREVPDSVLRNHPYGADEQLTEAYGRFLEVPPGQLVAARGASELIWQLASSPLGDRVAVPLPAYTEYRQAFPAGGVGSAGAHHQLELVVDLLAAGRVVLISNPHNPSGRAFPAAALSEAAASVCGRGVLIVDESYVEFADPAALSLIGCGLENVAVLRSPSKFFGLAGARIGVAWSANPELLAALTVRRGSWPVSAIEVAPVVAALADRRWQLESHAALRSDAAWLEDRVAAAWGNAMVSEAVTHFRLVDDERAAETTARLAVAGVAVRSLGRAHGLGGPAFRIAAPRADEREQVAAALADVVASRA